MILDVTQLYAVRNYGPEGHQQIDLASVVYRAQPAIEALMDTGHVQRSTSFGFVMANPALSGRYHEVWNEPYTLGWLAVGWNEWKPRVRNALCRMRAAARTGRDTLLLSATPSDGVFRDIVEPQEHEESALWGDLRGGGAVHFGFGSITLLGSVDCSTPEQNHYLAAMLLGVVGDAMHRYDTAAH